MTPAVLSLLALLAAIVLSCTSRINVGLLAIAFAWLIGTGPAGWRADQVMAGFPAALFLTLAGVTLLFGLAEVNGTLEQVARRVIRLSGGHGRVVPIVFFVAAGLLSSIGPGAISAVALLIPLAMAIGSQTGVPRVLTALMVANGANAGNLSPISAVGIIANSRMAEAGLGEHQFRVWFANFVAHLLVAVVAWLMFRRADASAPHDGPPPPLHATLSRHQHLTTAVIAAWIVGVVGFDLNVGLAAFVAASLLIVVGAGDEAAAIRRIPWGVILMVTGVTVLIGVLEKTGGLDLFTALLAAIATPGTINGTIAFVAGLISSWSSTSGVVLPALLPTVPTLVEQLGGGNGLAIALSINVGASMVDVSPLSTIGALCVATVTDPGASRVLFRQLLVWGLSMTIVSAILCQLLIHFLAA